jgi:hypothetical protein
MQETIYRYVRSKIRINNQLYTLGIVIHFWNSTPPTKKSDALVEREGRLRKF